MELLRTVIMGRGLGFCRFLSYSSTHGTTGGVHGIRLDVIIFEGMPKRQ